MVNGDMASSDFCHDIPQTSIKLFVFVTTKPVVAIPTGHVQMKICTLSFLSRTSLNVICSIVFDIDIAPIDDRRTHTLVLD
jgi:hypothetical protein